MLCYKKAFILPSFILVIWYLITAYQLFSPYLLPTPATTWSTFLTLCYDGILLQNLFISLQRVFAGFLLACFVAIPFGILCGRNVILRNYCWPILEFLRHVPPLAAIPLIILWFGIGEASKLVIIFLASFFPLFLNTYSGISNCDKKLLEVGRSLHFSPWQQAIHIQLPAALPAIATGLQLSLGYSWRALIGAELIAASSGIGYMILDAEQLSRPDIVLVGILSIGIICSLIDYIFLKLTNLMLPWNIAAGDSDVY